MYPSAVSWEMITQLHPLRLRHSQNPHSFRVWVGGIISHKNTRKIYLDLIKLCFSCCWWKKMNLLPFKINEEKYLTWHLDAKFSQYFFTNTQQNVLISFVIIKVMSILDSLHKWKWYNFHHNLSHQSLWNNMKMILFSNTLKWNKVGS